MLSAVGRANNVVLAKNHSQLSLILDILGTPSLDDFYAITSQRSREYLRALPFRKKRPFGQLFPNANPLVRAFPSSSLPLLLPSFPTNYYQIDHEL